MSAHERPISDTLGARLTGLLAVVYGVGLAFLPDDSGGLKTGWLYAGAAVVGVLFVVYLLIPFLRRVLRARSG